MPDPTLHIKVQSIGVVDAILTASILSGLVFQSGIVLMENLDDHFGSTSRKSLNHGAAGYNVEVEISVTTSEAFVSNQTVSETWWNNENRANNYAAATRGLRWWWMLFHDVIFGVGLALILGAALALIRSTSLKIKPGQAIKLVRIWLLGNILVVVIVSMQFVTAALTGGSCGGLDMLLAWSIFYLLVRSLCVWLVWKYLKQLTRLLPSLITTGPNIQ